MKTLKLSFAVCGIVLFPWQLAAQNISINTTGAVPSTTSMLEVLQPSTTASSISIFSRHSGLIAGTGYGLWSEITGASTTNIAAYFAASLGTNNYALIVPASSGIVGIGTITPTSTALLTINPTTNLLRNGIDMTLSGATSAATGLKITTADSDVNGITVTHSSAAITTSLYGIGGILSSTNIVSGYAGYRNSSGLSYGLYGINGTNAAYATSASTWAAFLQGRTVISSESSPTSLLGTDLEVRNTTTGAAAPATISLRQTTSLATNGNILANFDIGDNYVTTAQARIQVLRDAAASSSADMPTAIAFSTIADGNFTLTERMRIGNTGTVQFNAYTTNGIMRTTGGTGTLSSTGGNISLTSEVTGVLPIANGGTNRSTIGAAGTVAYSDGTNYQFMSAGTAGQVLTSQAAAAPTWTTPTTGTITGSGTATRVAFFTTASNISSTAAAASDLFWDNTNFRLGIRTATPAMALDVTSASTTLDDAAIRGTSTGAAQVYGVLGTTTSITTDASGVKGIANGVGNVNGVWGTTSSTVTSAAGVWGTATGNGEVYGVQGSTPSITNGATGVFGLSTGASGQLYGALGSITSTTINASGIRGYASGATGSTNGVWGENLSTSNGSAGVYGSSVAVLGTPIWGDQLNATTAGTNYSGSGTCIGVYGNNTVNIGANASMYHFGIDGTYDNTLGAGYGLRSGGVLGYELVGGAWGCLGYQSSASANRYGVYGSVAYASGAGFLPSSSINGIGIGGYGGVIGGWTRGEVMGHIAAGELFASYNLGNEYTSGYSAEVVTLKDKRVPAYSVTSTEIKVYNDGTAKLSNGKARVNFEQSFTELIGDNKPVVTITPMGQCNGIYISNIDSRGFEITELNNGNSNVDFSYILIGKRIDADNKPALPEALSRKDFDEKMKGVMFNENNLEQSATPVWWDGTKVRFDALRETKTEKKNDFGSMQRKKAIDPNDK